MGHERTMSVLVLLHAPAGRLVAPHLPLFYVAIRAPKGPIMYTCSHAAAVVPEVLNATSSRAHVLALLYDTGHQFFRRGYIRSIDYAECCLFRFFFFFTFAIVFS